MTNRVLLSPDGVRVSRPGVDVINPPALTEDYLVIDWTWPKIERLHAYGKVSGSAISASSFTFLFDALSAPPIVAVLAKDAGTNTYRDELIAGIGISHGADNIGYPFYSSYFHWYTRTDRVVVERLTSLISLTAFDYTILVFKNS